MLIPNYILPTSPRPLHQNKSIYTNARTNDMSLLTYNEKIQQSSLQRQITVKKAVKMHKTTIVQHTTPGLSSRNDKTC